MGGRRDLTATGRSEEERSKEFVFQAVRVHYIEKERSRGRTYTSQGSSHDLYVVVGKVVGKALEVCELECQGEDCSWQVGGTASVRAEEEQGQLWLVDKWEARGEEAPSCSAFLEAMFLQARSLRFTCFQLVLVNTKEERTMGHPLGLGQWPPAYQQCPQQQQHSPVQNLWL